MVPSCKAAHTASLSSGLFEGWVHLHPRAKPVVVGGVEKQMVGTSLGGHPFRPFTKDITLGSARDVQQMKAVLVSSSQIDGPRRTLGRRLRVPDFGVVRNDPSSVEGRRVGPNQGLVFTVGRNGQASLGKDFFQRLLFIDQQVTGGRPDENLDAAGSCLFPKPGGVLPGRSREEPIVHHA